MRSKPGPALPGRGLIEDMKSIGWGVLADEPGEIVMGAVTKPWEANPTFRALRPEQFASFAEPDYVKIAWTLRASPRVEGGSIFRTETRAVASDPTARKKLLPVLATVHAFMERKQLRTIKQRAEQSRRKTARSMLLH